MTAIALGSVSALLLAPLPSAIEARDNGQFKGSPLHQWFNGLQNQHHGLCCSFADGQSVEDVDWDTKDGHYRVKLYGQWIDVPDSALVTDPNKFGPAVVWPYQQFDAETKKYITAIRCFMPGAGT